MIKKLLTQFNISYQEKLFLFSVMICSFCICAEYAIIRPVSNSLFISSYTADALPYAWLAMVPLNFLIVSLYNRYLPRWGLFSMFLGIIGLVMSVNLFCVLFIKKFFWLPFIFYIWKEIYILLIFQQLWSLIHTTIKMERAKFFYGLIFAVGGLGGTLGGLIPAFLAVEMGSENLFLWGFPFYLLLIFSFAKTLKYAHGFAPLAKGASSIKESIKLIAGSRFLLFILLIVVFMQLSSTLIEFQFNTILEKNVSDKDLRTEYFGRILSLVNFITIGLQLFGTYLLVYFLGLRRSHLFIPSILGLNTIGFLLAPGFGMISFAFMTIKSFDFSLFRVITEMLYIPLKIEEKFHAKSFIDVFAYRTAKAFASFLILFLQFVGKESLTILSLSTLIIFGIWGLLAYRISLKSQEA